MVAQFADRLPINSIKIVDQDCARFDADSAYRYTKLCDVATGKRLLPTVSNCCL